MGRIKAKKGGYERGSMRNEVAVRKENTKQLKQKTGKRAKLNSNLGKLWRKYHMTSEWCFVE